jgi:hypothetical protein
MKGLELPINMIVVIAIAVLVLTVVAAFFVGQTGGGVDTVRFESAFTSACTTWRTAYNCADTNMGLVPVNFKFSGQTQNANMDQMCKYKILGSTTTGTYSTTDCQRLCGCSV